MARLVRFLLSHIVLIVCRDIGAEWLRTPDSDLHQPITLSDVFVMSDRGTQLIR